MIQPSTIISASGKIGKNVQIGAFCNIGDNVDIDDNCVFNSHIVVKGHSKIGKNNVFFQFCSRGGAAASRRMSSTLWRAALRPTKIMTRSTKWEVLVLARVQALQLLRVRRLRLSSFLPRRSRLSSCSPR